MDSTRATDSRGGARSAQDACATLVELGRALKGWLFYEVGSAARHDLVERAHRVFRGEIERNGPLALEVRRGAFWLARTDVAVGVGRLDDLARRLQDGGVGRVVFDAEMDAEALGALLDALVAEPGAVAAAGGLEGVFFSTPQRGVSLNDTDWRLIRPARVLAESELETTLPDLPAPAEVVAGESEDEQPELVFAEPLPFERAAEPPPIAEPQVLAEPARDEPEAIDLLDPLDVEPAPHGPGAEVPLEADDPPSAVPIEALRAIRYAPPVDELAERLIELAECDDDARYREAAYQLAFDAQVFVEEGRFDEPYRVLEALAAHCGDDAKRSFAQRESARECLVRLGQGAALGDLVRRACRSDTDSSLRAVGVLREIGTSVVPRLLDEIDAHGSDPDHRGRIASVLFALGEDAAPALATAIRSGTPRRQNAALRLAGEAQNPRLVPNLRDVLLGGPADAAREAAHSLMRIGDVSAFEVLAEALESDKQAVVTSAAHALAATGRALAVAPLAAAIDRALVASDQIALARDLVKSLGRLGRAEAVPVLCELIERGGFFQRRKLRDVKIAAVQALAHVSGRAADDALARVEKQGDAALREAAATARQRRTHDGAGRKR
jgi:HEAT repeat protein